MENVRSMLLHKGSEVFWLSPEATVYDAVAMMADKGIGALMVISAGKLAGIVSERDYARKVILKGKHSHEMQVAKSSPALCLPCRRNIPWRIACASSPRIASAIYRSWRAMR